jgi:hypothetical protein
MIDHKKLFYLLIVTSLLFQGCWEENYDYNYSVAYYNASSDTIVLSLHKDECFIQPDDIRSKTLVPGDTMGDNGMQLKKEEDPIAYYINESFMDEVGLYIMDDTIRKYSQVHFDGYMCPAESSLRKTWIGPLQDLPDSVHNIFNRNSWKIYDSIENWRIMMFTIYQSDLE